MMAWRWATRTPKSACIHIMVGWPERTDRCQGKTSNITDHCEQTRQPHDGMWCGCNAPMLMGQCESSCHLQLVLCLLSILAANKAQAPQDKRQFGLHCGLLMRGNYIHDNARHRLVLNPLCYVIGMAWNFISWPAPSQGPVWTWN